MAFQIPETIAHFLETFSRVGSAHQTVRAFRSEGLCFPSRLRNHDTVVFQPLTRRRRFERCTTRGTRARTGTGIAGEATAARSTDSRCSSGARAATGPSAFQTPTRGTFVRSPALLPSALLRPLAPLGPAADPRPPPSFLDPLRTRRGARDSSPSRRLRALAAALGGCVPRGKVLRAVPTARRREASSAAGLLHRCARRYRRRRASHTRRLPLPHLLPGLDPDRSLSNSPPRACQKRPKPPQAGNTMSIESWEQKVLRTPEAKARVGAIRKELRVAAGLIDLREDAECSWRASPENARCARALPAPPSSTRSGSLSGCFPPPP
jgi:hypothetical protein